MLNFYYEGILVLNDYFVGSASDGVAMPYGGIIDTVFLNARTSPVTDNAIIKIYNLTAVTDATATLTAGSTFEKNAVSLSFNTNDKLAMQVIQTGAVGGRGSGVNVTFQYT